MIELLFGGKEVKVLKPKSIKEEMIQMLEATLKQCKNK
jgi:predicted DNA-binding transcriptional regulator YafY